MSECSAAGSFDALLKVNHLLELDGVGMLAKRCDSIRRAGLDAPDYCGPHGTLPSVLFRTGGADIVTRKTGPRASQDSLRIDVNPTPRLAISRCIDRELPLRLSHFRHRPFPLYSRRPHRPFPSINKPVL